MSRLKFLRLKEECLEFCPRTLTHVVLIERVMCQLEHACSLTHICPVQIFLRISAGTIGLDSRSIRGVVECDIDSKRAV